MLLFESFFNTMPGVLVILAMIGVGTFFLYKFLKGKKDQSQLAAWLDVKNTKHGAKILQVSPSGKLNIIGQEVSLEMLKALDTGRAKAIAQAKCEGYNAVDTGVMWVEIQDGELFKGKPHLKIGGDIGAYAGTDYDKGGYVYAAGQYVAPTYGRYEKIIMPNSTDYAFTTEVFYNEWEHLLLNHLDPVKYAQTVYHVEPGSGHPIMKKVC